LEHLEHRDLDAAQAAFDEALAEDPWYVHAYNNRGVIWATVGELEDAIADYSAAINVDPEFAGAYLNRALAYEDLGLRELALADYERFVELYPLQDQLRFMAEARINLLRED
jgi:tetratricopeptide (TPR) repeat protein